MLIILRAGYEDADGRPLEEVLLPLAVPWPCRRFPATGVHAITELTTAILGNPGHAAGSALAAWRRSAEVAITAFYGRRLAREEAISAMARRAADAFQPGLFDRRAETARPDDPILDIDDAGESARPIGLRQRSPRGTAGSPRVVLVLAP